MRKIISVLLVSFVLFISLVTFSFAGGNTPVYTPSVYGNVTPSSSVTAAVYGYVVNLTGKVPRSWVLIQTQQSVYSLYYSLTAEIFPIAVMLFIIKVITTPEISLLPEVCRDIVLMFCSSLSLIHTLGMFPEVVLMLPIILRVSLIILFWFFVLYLFCSLFFCSVEVIRGR